MKCPFGDGHVCNDACTIACILQALEGIEVANEAR
jgi:hypothetical protein